MASQRRKTVPLVLVPIGLALVLVGIFVARLTTNRPAETPKQDLPSTVNDRLRMDLGGLELTITGVIRQGNAIRIDYVFAWVEKGGFFPIRPFGTIDLSFFDGAGNRAGNNIACPFFLPQDFVRGNSEGPFPEVAVVTPPDGAKFFKLGRALSPKPIPMPE